ncbi:MAG: radical SAM protein [Desulfobacterales bacterium]|jgi:MoaA/NifB/PqqE/SkfB family radical SAM enzyme
MIFDWLLNKHIFLLDWIQVEISSYCNALCIYCPHSAYKKNWQNRYLPLELFKKLVPAFKSTRLIYLQGWGEPFTHPQFFEMLRIAKEAGCQVGTTTNGTLLSKELIERLVCEGLDIIGFSLAGTDEKNDSIRKGTKIRKVLESTEFIHQAKNKYGVDNPKLHIAYMLLRSGLDDLDDLPNFLAHTGAAQTVMSSLSFIVNPQLESESVLAANKSEYLDLKHRLLAVKKTSLDLGTELHCQIVSPLKNSFSCSENCDRAVVIGSDGGVSPCVMTQIPVKRQNGYYFMGKKQNLQTLCFGNIGQDSLSTIRHRPEYKNFVRHFKKGDPPAVCQRCLKRYMSNLRE